MIIKTRKLAVFISAAILTLSFSVSASAENAVKVYVNDVPANSEAKVINGTVYVPLKTIGQSMGANVNWNPQEQIVSINSKQLNIPGVINKISPSVVGIVGKTKGDDGLGFSNRDSIAFGTGIIYKANGYIITNAHVVSNLENIIVVLSNGKAYEGRLKAIDEFSDLALVKIDKGGLIPAELGEASDIYVGEQVVAIGTPLSISLRNSATSGIVSGLNRPLESSYGLIQSDAAINAGNSGGPLVNMQGKVIGINSVKFQGIGIEGLSFSIPIDTVKYVVGHFEKYGKVKRPYLGAKFQESLAAKYGLPTEEGLTITEIEKDSPAEEAGLHADDILLSINGKKLSTFVTYNEETKKYLPGDTVEFKVLRNSNELTAKVTFSETK
ncbi:MAG: trypsin-like peptidase domain-containing protein [Clostridia bacterium]|nr:trypsin-like peptidase domain-containing protein [Clostridia bacterium]